jgi:hypothetical protein
MADIPRLARLSWVEDILPQLLWMGLLIDKLGPKRGAEVALGVVKAAEAAAPASTDSGERPEKAELPLTPAAADWYRSLDEEGRERLLQHLPDHDRCDLQEALLPMVAMYQECPLFFAVDPAWRANVFVDPQGAVETLSHVVGEAVDRRGKPATWIQAAALYTLMATRRVRTSDRALVDALLEIQRYPESEDSKAAASLIRASISAFFGAARGSRWSTYFWRHGFDISVCRYVEPSPGEGEHTEALLEALSASAQCYAGELLGELEERWREVNPDLAEPTRAEVLSGLLARQARFSSAVVRDPHLWSLDIGRIVLRCMVDTYITLRWLAEKGSTDDFESFVEHGLGQEKLLLEHLKAQVPSEVASEVQSQMDHMEQWINSQLYTFLLPVNIGAWKSIRQMAGELGALDIYNLSFAPHSADIHGTWNALARLNLRLCVNPLHGFHRAPTFDDPGLDLGTPSMAVDLMRRTFSAWAGAIGLAETHLKAASAFFERLALPSDARPQPG